MAKVKPVVVVIEDQAKLRRLLRNCLQEAGFNVREAETGKAGLVVAATRKPDLIILDLGLPDVDGVEVIRKLREWWKARPIIILSGRQSETDKIAALELGADDYITKPFGLPEFLARVRAALRRASRHLNPDQSTAFRAHGIAVDTLRRQVTRDGAPVRITPNEFRVLATLVKNAGMLVTTDTLVNELWGPSCPSNNRNYLRTYMASLRQKLESDPTRPRLLLTEPGVGYRLVCDAGDRSSDRPPADESQPGAAAAAETHA
jgi:two-component system KDP operon response regulator KdpE